MWMYVEEAGRRCVGGIWGERMGEKIWWKRIMYLEVDKVGEGKMGERKRWEEVICVMSRAQYIHPVIIIRGVLSSVNLRPPECTLLTNCLGRIEPPRLITPCSACISLFPQW
jgi:hypothetical protein